MELILIKIVLLAILSFYRKYISVMFSPHCRFHPTCSKYAIEAIEKYGSLKGMSLAIKRLLRCHRFNPGGYDPVP